MAPSMDQVGLAGVGRLGDDGHLVLTIHSGSVVGGGADAPHAGLRVVVGIEGGAVPVVYKDAPTARVQFKTEAVGMLMAGDALAEGTGDQGEVVGLAGPVLAHHVVAAVAEASVGPRGRHRRHAVVGGVEVTALGSQHAIERLPVGRKRLGDPLGLGEGELGGKAA